MFTNSTWRYFWENGGIVRKRLEILDRWKLILIEFIDKISAENLPSGITSHILQLNNWNFQFIKKLKHFPKFDGIFEKKKKYSKATRPWVKNINGSEASHQMKQLYVCIAMYRRTNQLFREKMYKDEVVLQIWAKVLEQCFKLARIYFCICLRRYL